MASPHVAGIAALYLGAHPTATPSQVKQAILANATSGHILNANGSPNLLAYSAFVGGTATPTATASTSFTAAFNWSCGTTDVCLFNASGSSVPNGVSSYNWSFGDGHSAGSLTASISHAYANAGTYTVKLLIVDKDGNKTSISKSVTVGATTQSSTTSSTIKPVIAVSCTGLYCAFNAKSSTVSAGASAYNWWFGDGHTATGLTVQHKYGSTGTFTSTLQIVDKLGHKSSVTRTVTVKS